MTRDVSVESAELEAGELQVTDGAGVAPGEVGALGEVGAPGETAAPVEVDAPDGNDFGPWLDDRRDVLVERWSAAVAARFEIPDPGVLDILRQFYDLKLRLLSGCFGPYRTQFDPILREVSELYGSLGAKRGLAAGEIIEEVQILREALIRLLFTDPPRRRGPAVLLREILRLNRLADVVVTFASVGHTDALFFALFQGSGAPEALTAEIAAETREQLLALRTESERLNGILGRS